MINKVRNYMHLHHMIDKGDKIVVGVSGGVDSVALLLVLLEMRQEYDLELHAVHINHGIRAEAAEDAQYVKELCDSYSVSFYLFEENIPKLAKEKKMTEEEMGRIYRYRCFFDVMKQTGAEKLAVAHHMDDQAETLLFHLVRGSRLAGMTGMRPVMDAWNGMPGRIIRPLLKCRKEELRNWLMSKNVIWKEDYTNQEDEYSRNRIRNRILPELEQVNAQAVVHMSEYAEEMAEYQDFFQKTVRKYVEENVRVVKAQESGVVQAESGVDVECISEVKSLPAVESSVERKNLLAETNRNTLVQQEAVLARAVIYEMLCQVCGRKKDIGNVHVQSVYDLLEGQSGKKLSLPYEMEAVISYEMLQIRKNLNGFHMPDISTDEDVERVFYPQKMLESGQSELEIELPQGRVVQVHLFRKGQCTESEWDKLTDEARNSKNNYTKFFECDTIKGTLCIRKAKKEDFFVMNDKGSTKRLSRYFIDRKIPVQQRRETLVVASENRVLWIIGERRCEEYKVMDDSTIIMRMTCKGEAYGTSD